MAFEGFEGVARIEYLKEEFIALAILTGEGREKFKGWSFYLLNPYVLYTSLMVLNM